MTDRLPLLLLLAGCAGGDEVAPLALDDPFTAEEAERVLQLSPLPEPPPDPTNAWADDPAAAALGRAIYFDERFSSSGAISCATCHDPERGFADGELLAQGLGTTRRHAQSIWNTAYNRWMFWDGRADSHWAQALGPMEDAGEHGFDRVAAYQLVATDDTLRDAYEAVFSELPDLGDLPEHGRPTPLDPESDNNKAWEALDDDARFEIDRLWSGIGKALAAFERTIVSRHAPIDDLVAAYAAGDAETWNAADPAVVEGMQIFVGKGNCHFCHLGPGLTSGEFHNIGLGPRDWLDIGDRARFDGIPTVLADPFNGAGEWSDDPIAGTEKLAHLVQGAETMGQYKVPGLRNVALTAPYMHGGHFGTLEEVVRYYNEVTELTAWGHREELLVPLELSDAEVLALVAFLEALTGDDLASAPTGPTEGPTGP